MKLVHRRLCACILSWLTRRAGFGPAKATDWPAWVWSLTQMALFELQTATTRARVVPSNLAALKLGTSWSQLHRNALRTLTVRNAIEV
jgi:hypothetical protein